MNKFNTLALALLSSLSMSAALNTMNYQAVINNTEGKPASDTPVGLRFSIVDGENILFTEETVVKSDANGMVQWQIGSSSPEGLEGIDWGTGRLSLQVGVDLDGGTDYTSVYTSTLQSVPTAMYAVKSGDSENIIRDVYDNRARIEELRFDTYDGMEGLRKELETLIFENAIGSDIARDEIRKLMDERLFEMEDAMRAEFQARLAELEKRHEIETGELLANVSVLEDRVVMLDAERERMTVMAMEQQARIEEQEHRSDRLEEMVDYLMHMVDELRMKVDELENR